MTAINRKYALALSGALFGVGVLYFALIFHYKIPLLIGKSGVSFPWACFFPVLFVVASISSIIYSRQTAFWVLWIALLVASIVTLVLAALPAMITITPR